MTSPVAVIDGVRPTARTGAQWTVNPTRVAALTLIGLAVVLWAGAIAWYAQYPRSLGFDYAFYRDIGARFLGGGPVYWPYQLAGPYDFTGQLDNLYPPNALLLFGPAAALPWPLAAFLWWAIPLGVIGYAFWRWRPQLPSLAVALFLLSTPKMLSAVVMGNTDLWLTATVAAALLWGWPAVFVLLKPTLAPFMLIGIRRRAWWAALGVMALTLVMLPLWLDYITAMRNIQISTLYSWSSVPLLVAPVVAWADRRIPGWLLGVIVGATVGSIVFVLLAAGTLLG
jgi:hypothetical protein